MKPLLFGESPSKAGSDSKSLGLLDPAGLLAAGEVTVPDLHREWFGTAFPPGRIDASPDLPDRLVTLDWIGEALARAHRAGHELVLLLIGAEQEANDGMPDGKAAIDGVANEVLERVRTVLAGRGAVARVSANAFAVMISGEAATAWARRSAGGILDVLARPFSAGRTETRLSAAVGASSFPRDATRPDVLLARAGQALGAARRAGPNAFRTVQPRTRAGTDGDTLIRAQLDGAAARNELVLHYQPKFDLTSGCISGAEALVRWRHPELGLVEPARFIPLAEASGVIAPIGEWVLHVACEQVRRWRDQGLDLRVGVNVSARQFREGDLAQRILDILRAHKVDARGIEIELTESTVMDDASTVIAALQRLKAHGVRVAIDDFGTGYASLSYLMHLPVDVVKIDRSYVRNVGRRPEESATVKAIIRFARALGMGVIAEGVESGAEAQSLREWGCHHAQGFYFGRPVDAEEFEARFGVRARTRNRNAPIAAS